MWLPIPLCTKIPDGRALVAPWRAGSLLPAAALRPPWPSSILQKLHSGGRISVRRSPNANPLSLTCTLLLINHWSYSILHCITLLHIGLLHIVLSHECGGARNYFGHYHVSSLIIQFERDPTDLLSAEISWSCYRLTPRGPHLDRDNVSLSADSACQARRLKRVEAAYGHTRPHEVRRRVRRQALVCG